MNNSIFKRNFLAMAMSCCFAFSSYGMGDLNEKSADTQVTCPLSPPVSQVNFDVESTIKEMMEQAKHLSTQHKNIHLPYIMDTIKTFEAPGVKAIYSYLVATFFSDGSNWKAGLEALANPHKMKTQENMFKLHIFDSLKTLAHQKEEDVDQNSVNALKKLIPNFENLKKLASRKKVAEAKIIKEMKDIKGFSFGTFHFENFVKYITTSSDEITLDSIKEKLLEHMDKYLNSLIRTYQEAKARGKEREFFQEAFGPGCKVLRFGYLQSWTLKYVLQIEEENEFLRSAKEKIQTKGTTKFNPFQLNARMIYLMRSRCLQLDFPVDKLANEQESAIHTMAKYIYSCLNSYEKEAIRDFQSEKPRIYIFNILNTFLDDFRSEPTDSIKLPETQEMEMEKDS